jgi:hypothetical protein
MSATLAVLRQPWTTRRRSARTLLGMLLLLALPISLIAFAPGFGAAQAVGGIGLAWLVYGWWLAVDGLLRQNQPRLARLVPGQLGALRQSLALQALGFAAAAFACLSLAVGPRAEWPWLIATVMLLLVWVQREPLLWFPLAMLAPTVPPLRLMSAELVALPLALQWLGLGALLLLMLAALGGGGAWHRWSAARTARWEQASRLTREGREPSAATQGGWVHAIARQFTWPRDRYQAALLRHASPRNALARLNVGLGIGGQSLISLWVLVLIMLSLAAVALIKARLGTSSGLGDLLTHGRIGLTVGLFSMLCGSLLSRPTQLWARRREQNLLVLLPGVPTQPELVEQLERRWRHEYLAFWMLASALALVLGAAKGSSGLQYAAAHAACCLPMCWMAQARHRRLHRAPGFQLWLLAPALAALPAYIAQQMELPVWLSLSAGALVYACCARRNQALTQALLPIGRHDATAAAR